MALPWTPEHVQTFLKKPHRLLETEPWHTWIVQHGGVQQVYATLTQLPLPQRELQVLEIMISNPGATNNQYAELLYMHRATFQRTLRRLLDALSIHLLTLPAGAVGPSAAAVGPTNLPVPMTPLIGRTDVLVAITAAVLNPAIRLITLTGPGGIGKTRLAIQVGWNVLPAFAAGCVFVPLTEARDPTLILSVLLAALELAQDDTLDRERQLGAYLAPRQLCLVLDNAEHLFEAMPLLTRLLRQAPQLTILVTSRVPLDLYGEHLITVPPLAVPPLDPSIPFTTLQAAEAIQLFATRAQAVNQQFTLTPATIGSVHTICAKLDGIALAIELAAAHVRTQPVEALIPRLAERLTFLTNGPRDVDARHQTLRATIAWSYDLLDAVAQAVFRRLSVFVDGWTVPAMVAVCADGCDHAAAETAVQRLLRQHLVVPLVDLLDEPRYGMLETIRDYASECLIAHGEEPTCRLRHLHAYGDAAERIEPGLIGAHQDAWQRQVQASYPNLRAALLWSITAGEHTLGVRLAGALWRYWWGLHTEVQAEAWLRQLIEQTRATADPGILARALQGLGALLMGHRPDEALRIFTEAVAASQRAADPWRTASILNAQGTCFMVVGDYAAARATYTESLRLRRALEDPGEISASLFNFGMLAYMTGAYAEAEAYYTETMTIFQAVGDSGGIVMLLNNLGALALAQGHYDQAEQYLTACLPQRHQVGAVGGIIMTSLYLAEVTLHRQQPRKARAMLRDVIRTYPTLEGLDNLAHAVRIVTLIEFAERRMEGVMAIYGAMQHLWMQHGMQDYPVYAADRQRILAHAEVVLGAPGLQAALAAGQGMTAEQISAAMLTILTRRPRAKRPRSGPP